MNLSTVRQYMVVAKNIPNETCMVRSVMAVRNNREPNWLDVSDNVTIVIENTTPDKVIIPPDNNDSVARAVGAFTTSQPRGPCSLREMCSSTQAMNNAENAANRIMPKGTNQNPARIRSQI